MTPCGVVAHKFEYNFEEVLLILNNLDIKLAQLIDIIMSNNFRKIFACFEDCALIQILFDLQPTAKILL